MNTKTIKQWNGDLSEKPIGSSNLSSLQLDWHSNEIEYKHTNTKWNKQGNHALYTLISLSTPSLHTTYIHQVLQASQSSPCARLQGAATCELNGMTEMYTVQCTVILTTADWYRIICCMAPLSMTLNDSWPRFQGHAIIQDVEYLRNSTR